MKTGFFQPPIFEGTCDQIQCKLQTDSRGFRIEDGRTSCSRRRTRWMGWATSCLTIWWQSWTPRCVGTRMFRHNLSQVSHTLTVGWVLVVPSSATRATSTARCPYAWQSIVVWRMLDGVNKKSQNRNNCFTDKLETKSYLPSHASWESTRELNERLTVSFLR